MKKLKSDHALAIVKAGVAGVPIVGGILASLIGDYIPTSTKRCSQEAVNMFVEEVARLGNRIDAECGNKEEFAELFKSCSLVIVRSHQKEKLRGAAKLLANIFLKDGDSGKLSFTELDHFVRCLDSLSIGAIGVLGCAIAISRQRSPKHVGVKNVRFNFEELTRQIPDMDVSLLMGLAAELHSMNLLHLPGGSIVLTPNYGNYPVELTSLGKKFVDHVLSD